MKINQNEIAEIITEGLAIADRLVIEGEFKAAGKVTTIALALKAIVVAISANAKTETPVKETEDAKAS